jgi:hypothetical protein
MLLEATLKNTVEEIRDCKTNIENNEKEIICDQNYINQLAELIDSISDKSATIAQLENGTVLVSETRIVVYKYTWDSEKRMFVKHRSRNSRNSRNNKIDDSSCEADQYDIE